MSPWIKAVFTWASVLTVLRTDAGEISDSLESSSWLPVRARSSSTVCVTVSLSSGGCELKRASYLKGPVTFLGRCYGRRCLDLQSRRVTPENQWLRCSDTHRRAGLGSTTSRGQRLCPQHLSSPCLLGVALRLQVDTRYQSSPEQSGHLNTEQE